MLPRLFPIVVLMVSRTTDAIKKVGESVTQCNRTLLTRDIKYVN